MRVLALMLVLTALVGGGVYFGIVYGQEQPLRAAALRANVETVGARLDDAMTEAGASLGAALDRAGQDLRQTLDGDGARLADAGTAVVEPADEPVPAPRSTAERVLEDLDRAAGQAATDVDQAIDAVGRDLDVFTDRAGAEIDQTAQEVDASLDDAARDIDRTLDVN